MSLIRHCLALSVCALLALPAASLANPHNDNRNSAQSIAVLPATVTGTTDGAGIESGEAAPCVPDDANSVWYRYDAKHTVRVVARLRAGGDLDATLSVYLRLRSQQRGLTCDVSDTRGRAATAFTARKGLSYLIRVARQSNSVSGNFQLGLQPARTRALPGPPLPASGVAGSLDRVAHTAQPWSVVLRKGVPYRIALEQPAGQCVTASLYAPRALRNMRPALTHLVCGHDYALYTPKPGGSGRYTIMVNARYDLRGPQRYHLQVARAGADDEAPGVLIGNHVRVGGTLDGGGIDILDLYRFNVRSQSKLYLRLQAHSHSHFDLMLLDPLGHRLGCACNTNGDSFLDRILRRGNYYIGVRAKAGTGGTYRVLRNSRAITHDHLSIASSILPPGAPEQLQVSVSPAVSGLVVITVEQLDPLAGWQFRRTLHAQAVNGLATIAWTPPSVGHWRVSARYEATRFNAASSTGFQALLVTNPLIGG
jgi:hypothetical protein